MSNTQVVAIPEQTADETAAIFSTLLKRKKNAIAQANFRARRDAYISSLERAGNYPASVHQSLFNFNLD